MLQAQDIAFAEARIVVAIILDIVVFSHFFVVCSRQPLHGHRWSLKALFSSQAGMLNVARDNFVVIVI